MDSLSSFFAMGGYAVFVWPAFSISAVVLAGLVWTSLRRLRLAEAELAALDTKSDDAPEPATGPLAGAAGSAEP